jgi:hypothetical protein
MRTTMSGSTPHLTDDELMRIVDAESIDQAGPSSYDAAQHVLACTRCRTELDRLRADALLLRELLERASFEQIEQPTGAAVGRDGPPRHRYVAPWLRAAAVLALIAGPVAALPSLRAWILDGISGAPAGEPAALREAAPAVAGAVIRFVPAAELMTVSLDVVQADGSIRLQYGPGPEAVLETVGDAAAGPVVSENGVRIRNLPLTSASYSLQVPASVHRVVVRVGPASTVVDSAMLATGAVLPAGNR